MKNGKISENILKRSVLKQINSKRQEIISGAGLGVDCAVFSCLAQENCVVSTDTVTAANLDAIYFGIHKSVNNIAATGAHPLAVWLSILLPPECEETTLKTMMKQADETCAKLEIQIAGGHTEVTENVLKPVITITAAGTLDEKRKDLAKAGLDIVVSKWIGLEGTAILAAEREEELLKKYPFSFIEEAKDFKRQISVVPEAATAVKSGEYTMHDASQGGIFGALWELAQRIGVGLEIDLKKLPIRQETVEICEFFGLNPYELLSGGSMLFVASNGFDLVKALEKEHIPAVVVGKTTDNNDRCVINDDERRFLELPKSDEIFKLKGEKK